MSDSLFLNQHICQFALSHPQERGWSVYEVPWSLARHSYLQLLLDYLRDGNPEIIEYRATMKELSHDGVDDRPLTTPSTHGDCGSSDGREEKWDSSDWYGEIHLAWRGHRIHIVSLLLPSGGCGGGGYATSYHVATNSDLALRELIAEVERYGKSKNRDIGRYMYVVNGEDIPIVPMSWDEVILPPHFAESIRHNVSAFFQGEACYRSLGLPHRRGLLFTGPPGCGKTLTLKALIHETAAKVVTVLGTAQVGDRDIDTAFRLAMKAPTALVIFEDLDKLLRSQNIALAHFLNLLDGFKTLSGVMVIATSNEPELLDPALLYRPSRFDRVWRFPLPGTEERLALLQKRGGAHFSEQALQEVAENSEGFSMAQVQEVIVDALLQATHEGLAPTDADLLLSLQALQCQRKDSGRKVEALGGNGNVGFTLSSGTELRAEKQRNGLCGIVT